MGSWMKGDLGLGVRGNLSDIRGWEDEEGFLVKLY